MYANLRVDVAAHPVEQNVAGELLGAETFYAWKVELGLMPDAVLIHLNAQDGEGNHAVEDGERVIDLHTHRVTITASF